jgi:hypothetical protein
VGGRDTDFEGVCHWQGGFEQHYKTGAGKSRAERKESLDGILDHLPLHSQKLSRSRSV